MASISKIKDRFLLEGVGEVADLEGFGGAGGALGVEAHAVGLGVQELLDLRAKAIENLGGGEIDLEDRALHPQAVLAQEVAHLVAGRVVGDVESDEITHPQYLPMKGR